MQVLETKVMRGPNYWSNYRKKLIVIKLDLEDYQELTTDKIPNFTENLKQLIPTLYQHRCSENKLGGFLERLAMGTLLGHVFEHIALELQTLAGMECGYGRARTTQVTGVYHVVFSYQIEKAGLYAASAAFKIIQTLVEQKPYLELENDLKELRDIYARYRPGPSTEALLIEAERQDIPYFPMDHSGTYILGYGAQQKIISATLTSSTSSVGEDLVSDKDMTKEILMDEFVPVPLGLLVRSVEELTEKVALVGFPLVVKPRFGNHGRGIVTNIQTLEKAIFAFMLAQQISKDVIIERFIVGSDYRFLVVNYKVCAVAKRTPAMVVGDGQKTVQELINIINMDTHRGLGHENILTRINVDEITLNILKEKNLALDSILPQGMELHLKDTANISSGGTAEDVTEWVHPLNNFLVERAARLMNLNLCGIDVISKDVRVPLTKNNGAILEVNAAPGLRMHLSPLNGCTRNVAKPIMQMLFPSPKSARVPLVAITGTNGKTTVVRLLAHLATQAGFKVGYATTDGIYINNTQVYDGDCSGPKSAKVVLRDPIVDFCVLECARGGIIRSGLGFDKSSASIVTNVSEDHLDLNDIHTLDELAKVKSVVPHSTMPEGHAILNADDDLVFNMSKELNCQIALFSLFPDNPRIKEHIQKGGLCCYVENVSIILNDCTSIFKIAKTADVPLSFGGKSVSMIQNILPAVLAAYTHNISVEQVQKGLMTFLPSPKNTPGRMNLFVFKQCTVMVDYAHNESAYISMTNYVKTIKARKKIAVIAGTGDRRPSDIKKTGLYAAQVFDEIIIRHDLDPRGRSNEEITDLILQGIKEARPNLPVFIISNEFEAVQFAIDNAVSGSFIWYFPDKISRSLEFLQNLASSKKYQTEKV